MNLNTEAVPESAAKPAMTLTDAQEMAAEWFRTSEKYAADTKRAFQRARDEVSLLEDALPRKRIDAERAANEYDIARALLREALSLFRDLMELKPDEDGATP